MNDPLEKEFQIPNKYEMKQSAIRKQIMYGRQIISHDIKKNLKSLLDTAGEILIS